MNHLDERIPIVFAVNDNYVPYLGVALHSLIKYASAHLQYDIHILFTDINQHHRQRLQSMERENIHILFVDVSEQMNKNCIYTKHFSKETAYRLVVEQLFSEYEKILYLDCDIVINRDVALLYQEDIGSAIIGACRGYIMADIVPHITKEVKVPVADYFNAGILLINARLFKKYHIGTKGLEMLTKKQYECPDQDVLNILCHGKVKYLDRKWNVEWQYLTGDGIEMFVDETRKDYKEDLKEPYIVHYTSLIKPWKYPEYRLAEYFWRYARESIFYEEILKKNINIEHSHHAPSPFERFIFPWEGVKPKSNIILYGGGAVGKTYISQIKETKYCTILAVCDTYPEKVKDVTLPIIAPDALSAFSYDMILIAIENEKAAHEIRNGLLDRGIEENKIYWKNPNRDKDGIER